jgi:hypothetical protein
MSTSVIPIHNVLISEIASYSYAFKLLSIHIVTETFSSIQLYSYFFFSFLLELSCDVENPIITLLLTDFGKTKFHIFCTALYPLPLLIRIDILKVYSSCNCLKNKAPKTVFNLFTIFMVTANNKASEVYRIAKNAFLFPLSMLRFHTNTAHFLLLSQWPEIKHQITGQ